MDGCSTGALSMDSSRLTDISLEDFINHMRESVMVTDAAGAIQAVNHAFSFTTGYLPREVIGKNPRLLKSGRQGRNFYKALWASVQTIGFWEGEIQNRRKNGEIYPEWLTITALKNKAGRIKHYLGVFTDITERKRHERRLSRLALYDSLTLLPNRTLFHDRLRQALIHARRDNRMMAILLFDLDHFKKINDSLGHAAGDFLLKGIGHRLRNCAREGDTVARIGGDEFAAILPAIAHRDDAAEVARKIAAAIHLPFQDGKARLSITASIGIAIYPTDGRDSKTLFNNADRALYRVKSLGRNAFRFYALDVRPAHP